MWSCMPKVMERNELAASQKLNLGMTLNFFNVA